MSISFVIPTYNSQRHIIQCLKSIYLNVNSKFEILIIDGGSVDNTLNLVKNYDSNIKVFLNRKKTAEAGKLIGIKKSKFEYICLLDSDNFLEKDYIDLSIKELNQNKKLLGAEPIKFSYNYSDGIIDRFCSIYGVNDPINLYIGNFDKFSSFHNDWTKANYTILDDNNMRLIFEINFSRKIPTIGANGSIFRKDDLTTFIKNKDYFFDVDFIIYFLNLHKSCTFIKVKKGISHGYCGGSFKNFYLKQSRRIKDYLYFKKIRLSYKRGYNFGIYFFIHKATKKRLI